jgi:hypothetical protein
MTAKTIFSELICICARLLSKVKLEAVVIVTKVGKPSRDIYALYATYST